MKETLELKTKSDEKVDKMKRHLQETFDIESENLQKVATQQKQQNEARIVQLEKALIEAKVSCVQLYCIDFFNYNFGIQRN